MPFLILILQQTKAESSAVCWDIFTGKSWIIFPDTPFFSDIVMKLTKPINVIHTEHFTGEKKVTYVF